MLSVNEFKRCVIDLSTKGKELNNTQEVKITIVKSEDASDDSI